MTGQHRHTEACEPLPHCDVCGRPMIPSRSVAAGDVGVCDRPDCRALRDARRATPRGSSAPPAEAPAAVPPGPTSAPKPRAATARRNEDQAAAVAGELDKIRAGKPARFLDLLRDSFRPRRPKATMPDGSPVPATMYGRPTAPPIVADVFAPRAFPFARDYVGPATVLDRTAAWLAAISTVEVAYGQLQHAGPVVLPESGPILPGYYLVRVSLWADDSLPSPLPVRGRIKAGDTVWVPEPLVKLLRDLAVAGRWGGGALDVVDSYTYPVAVRLNEAGWSDAMRDIRSVILEEFGRESDQYRLVKDGYAEAIRTMHGRRGADGSWIYTASGLTRDDIADAVVTASAVNLWRNADAINRLAPGAPVVALQNTDEIVIPDAALAAILDTKTPGRPRLDETGHALGSYKTKRVQEWSVTL